MVALLIVPLLYRPSRIRIPRDGPIVVRDAPVSDCTTTVQQSYAPTDFP